VIAAATKATAKPAHPTVGDTVPVQLNTIKIVPTSQAPDAAWCKDFMGL